MYGTDTDAPDLRKTTYDNLGLLSLTGYYFFRLC